MEDIFFKYSNKLQPQKGYTLISEPYLPDPNFQRTVVLLCEHSEEGTFGFVMNKKAKATLKDLIDIEVDPNPEIFIGGPVQRDTLHFLHRSKTFGEGVEIYDGMFWGGNFDHLLDGVSTGDVDLNDFRFFVGYSGWSEGQLQSEIAENSWIVTRGLPSGAMLDTDPDHLWREILRSMGGKYEMFSKYPEDPRLN